MKSVHAQGATSGLLLLCLLASGCNGNVAGAPPAKATLTVEKIVESADLVIVRVHMSFPGSRTIHVFEQGSAQTASIDPADKSKPGECDLLIAADLVDTGEKQRPLKWLHQIQSPHVTVGGPSTYTIDKDAKLPELVKIEIQPGQYDFGTEIEVATFQGRPLKMTIE